MLASIANWCECKTAHKLNIKDIYKYKNKIVLLI